MSVSVVAALDPQGPAADGIAGLWWLMLWLGVAVFVVFLALLVMAVRREPAQDRTEDSGAQARADRWFVGWGVVGPGLVIVVVFGATLVAMASTPTTAPEGALVVDVTAKQYAYDISYPDTDVATTDELWLPVGRPVALQLTSDDVIHSFWVPQLGGKMDMLPERVNTLVLEADEPGEHISRCAEFCGLEHANMQLTVRVVPQDEFDAWLAGGGGVASGDGGGA